MELPFGLRERYTLRGVLGRGGFGVVLDAADRQLGRPVALKLLSLGAPDPSMRERFEREARVTANLEHPHVVRVFDFGTEGEVAWIAYERIDGGSLGELSAGGQTASRQDLLRWGEQAAEALEAAHQAGVVHRDVKPENLLLRDTGELVLADFGIARSSRDGTMRTPEGMILGTPPFMAPEVILGEVPTPATDQFALAASLYLLAAGRTVYGTASLAGILDRVRQGFEPPDHPWIPGIQRALDREPSARFPDLATWARTLAGDDSLRETTTTASARRGNSAPTLRLDEERAIEVTRQTALERAPPRRRPWGLMSVGMGLVLSVGFGLSLLRSAQPPPEAPPLGSDGPPREGHTEALRATTEALAVSYRAEDGRLVPSYEAHVDEVLPALLDIQLVRQVRELLEALAAWMRETEEPVDHIEFWTASGVLANVLEDLQVASRTASRVALQMDRTAAQRARAKERLRLLAANVRALKGVAEEVLVRLDGDAGQASSSSRGILRARLSAGLGLEQGREALREVEALLREWKVGPNALGVLRVHLDLLRSPWLDSVIPLDERFASLREIGGLAAATPASDSPPFDEARAAYFSLHFDLCRDWPNRVGPEDGAVADQLLDMLEGFVDAGRRKEVHAALERTRGPSTGWQGGSWRDLKRLPGWQGGSWRDLKRLPGWRGRFRRMRALLARSGPG